jgi:hypothetical protein
VSPSFPCTWALTVLWMMTGTSAHRGPIHHCSHVQASSPSHGTGHGQQVRHTRIMHHSAYPLSTVGGVRLSWPLVMSRHGCTSLLMSGSCAAMPRVVEVRHWPGMGARVLARVLAHLQRSGEAEPIPEGSGKVEPIPKGSGDMEPLPKGLGEAAPLPEGSGEVEPVSTG